MESAYLQEIRRQYCDKARLVTSSQEAALKLGRDICRRVCLQADKAVKTNIQAMEGVVTGKPLDAEALIPVADGVYPVVVHVKYTSTVIELSIEITGSKR